MTGFHEIPFRSIQYGYLSTPSSFRHGRRANGRSARVVGALDRFEVCRGWVAAEGGNHTNGGRKAASPTGEAANLVISGHVFALAICQPHDVIMLSVLFLRMWWMCWCVCHSYFGVQCKSILMKDLNSTSTSCDGSGPRSSMNSLQHPSPGPQFVWQLSFVSFRGGSRAMLMYDPDLCYLTKWKINHQSNSKRNERFGSISINGCNMSEQTIFYIIRVFYSLVWYL